MTSIRSSYQAKTYRHQCRIPSQRVFLERIHSLDAALLLHACGDGKVFKFLSRQLISAFLTFLAWSRPIPSVFLCIVDDSPRVPRRNKPFVIFARPARANSVMSTLSQITAFQLTSFSSKLYIPSCAWAKDSANFSSALFISSSGGDRVELFSTYND